MEEGRGKGEGGSKDKDEFDSRPERAAGAVEDRRVRQVQRVARRVDGPTSEPCVRPARILSPVPLSLPPVRRHPPPLLRPTSFSHLARVMDTIIYRQYSGESELPHIMALVQHELSEPYVIYTYRYFLQQWCVPSPPHEPCREPWLTCERVGRIWRSS